MGEPYDPNKHVTQAREKFTEAQERLAAWYEQSFKPSQHDDVTEAALVENMVHYAQELVRILKMHRRYDAKPGRRY